MCHTRFIQVQVYERRGKKKHECCGKIVAYVYSVGKADVIFKIYDLWKYAIPGAKNKWSIFIRWWAHFLAMVYETMIFLRRGWRWRFFLIARQMCEGESTCEVKFGNGVTRLSPSVSLFWTRFFQVFNVNVDSTMSFDIRWSKMLYLCVLEMSKKYSVRGVKNWNYIVICNSVVDYVIEILNYKMEKKIVVDEIT